jgi:Fic family protein
MVTERQMAAAFADALRRAQAEFIEMPGLKLTVAQASRLWHFDSALCTKVLSTLVEQRFLKRTTKQTFYRA